MHGKSLIVLMVDGLRARALGAYGNTWFPTPALDRFASESLVVERLLAESTDLSALYQSLWTGRHAMLPPQQESGPTFIETLAGEGYHCQMVTDEQTILDHPLAEAFHEGMFVDTATTEFARELPSTGFGQVMTAAAELASNWPVVPNRPQLLWAHLRGFCAPWDAPPEFAASLLADDDPELTPSVDPPYFTIDNAEESADEVFHATCRYAGQVMALDECLGAFVNVLTALSPNEPPHIVLAGTRGYPLGEHAVVGAETPHSEQFHVPLLIRHGAGARLLQRHRTLMQTSDVFQVLDSLIKNEMANFTPLELAWGATPGGSQLLQTDQWHYVHNDSSEGAGELYVKPDDQWEANDVATRRPDELAQFSQIAELIIESAKNGESWQDAALIERYSDEAQLIGYFFPVPCPRSPVSFPPFTF